MIQEEIRRIKKKRKEMSKVEQSRVEKKIGENKEKKKK